MRRLLATLPLAVASLTILCCGAGRAESEAPKKGPYWLGLSCHRIEVTAENKLGAKEGLIVERVLEGGPAAKAGLQQGDVILSANGNPLAQVEQLVRAVADSQGRELKLLALREGTARGFEVLPARRPAQVAEEEEDDDDDDDDRAKNAKTQTKETAQLQSALDALIQKAKAGGRAEAQRQFVVEELKTAAPQRFSVVKGALDALPADMKVTIEKQGNQPARIEVTQGEQYWRTTERHMEMLPPAARAYAGRVLGNPVALAAPGAPMEIRRVELKSGDGRFEVARPGALRLELREEGAEKPQGPKTAPAKPGSGGVQFQIEGKRIELPVKAAEEGITTRKIPGGGIQIELRGEKGETRIENPKPESKEIKKPAPSTRELELREIERFLERIEQLKRER